MSYALYIYNTLWFLSLLVSISLYETKQLRHSANFYLLMINIHLLWIIQWRSIGVRDPPVLLLGWGLEFGQVHEVHWGLSHGSGVEDQEAVPHRSPLDWTSLLHLERKDKEMKTAEIKLKVLSVSWGLYLRSHWISLKFLGRITEVHMNTALLTL